MKIQVEDARLQQAAGEGMDSFIQVVVDAIREYAGGEMTAESLARLEPDQITLWAYVTLRDELCDGGFIQLIHNEYGPFFFQNPFAKAMRLWGLKEFSKFLYKARELYEEHADVLTKPCSDEEFMALYEQFPAFEDLDDEFMEKEEEITGRIAYYLDEHIHDFIEIINGEEQ